MASTGDPSNPITMPFCDNGHWRFGWGDGLYNFHEQHLPLWTTFGPCTREPGTFAEEVAVAARKIAAAADKPIYITMSGGLDSEVIAKVFLKEKIPFTPLIAEYDNYMNRQDIFYALHFCETHKLTPEILKIDIVAFLENCINTTYILGKCPFLFIMHLMRHAASLGGMAVIGGGEQKYKKEVEKIYMPVPTERMAVVHFMQAEKVAGVPSFYCHTPELMLAFLREAKAFGFERLDPIAHQLKERIYLKFWPDLAKRAKLHGFEKVEHVRGVIQTKLALKYGAKLATVMIPIDEFEKQLAVP